MRLSNAPLIATTALLIGCFAPAAPASADPAPAPAPSPAPAPAPATIASNGTFTVGKDIQPGTYSSAGPVDDGACYWKRTSGDTMVDNAMTKKPQIVQILATDTTFKTSDCQPWQKIDDCLPGCGPAAMNPGDLLSQLGGMLLRGPGTPPAPTAAPAPGAAEAPPAG